MDGLRFGRLPTSPRFSLEYSGNENAPNGALLSDKACFRSLTNTFEIQAYRTGRDLQIFGNIAVAVTLRLEL